MGEALDNAELAIKGMPPATARFFREIVARVSFWRDQYDAASHDAGRQ
jgi:hypothetical protein